MAADPAQPRNRWQPSVGHSLGPVRSDNIRVTLGKLSIKTHVLTFFL